ncbi:MAG: TonB-dependent receptor [Caulobacteraceae bacterium]
MSALALMSLGSVAAAQDASGGVDAIIVTGTRATTRTVASSLAPIDVLPAVDLQKSGKLSPRDLISTLVPSATTSNSGAGASFAVKTVSLRGLSADQTLVLVNGKRRHNTAVLFVNGTTQNGQSPPDMDLIPVSAIDHIEVLRDGAAAQYGSDALAGVINIILKKTPDHGSVSVLGGKYIDGGGLTEQGTGNVGLKVFDGSLNLSLDVRENGYVDRGVNYVGTFFAPYDGGPNPDPRENTADRHINHPGQPAIQVYSAGEDFEYPIGDVATVYAFGTASSRYSRAWLTPRLPNGTANQIAEVYPFGYSPKLRLIDHDWQQNVGVKSPNLFGFTTDLSTSFSQDTVDFKGDSLNASYGPASPTRFYLGSMQTQESTTNLDLTRSLPTGLFAKPLFLAGGVEYRWDQLIIKTGDVASYADGGYVATSGPSKGVVNQAGAQGVSGFGPLSAGTYSRNNVSLYANGEQEILPNWEFSVAGRYEHYSDFGDAETYKVSTRYEPVHGFALRGTVSSGFRAPSLQQEHYASASTIGVKLPGAATTSLYPVQLLPPDSAAAKALGATPLKPETSNNYSVGFVAQPYAGLTFTVDLYDIDIKNRILQSASLGPAVAVSNVLASVGLNPQQAVFFYTNGADTRTYGVDLVAEYRKSFGDLGRFHWTFSADLNHTKFLRIEQPTASLAAAGLVLVDRARQGDFTLGNPREKFIFSTQWQILAPGQHPAAQRLRQRGVGGFRFGGRRGVGRDCVGGHDRRSGYRGQDHRQPHLLGGRQQSAQPLPKYRPSGRSGRHPVHLHQPVFAFRHRRGLLLRAADLQLLIPEPLRAPGWSRAHFPLPWSAQRMSNDNKRGPSRRLNLLLSAALLAAPGAAGAASSAPVDPPKVSPRDVIVDVTVDEGTSMAVSVSPDGKQIVADLQGSLWIMPAAGGPMKRITDLFNDARQPVWSPDGKTIAFFAYRDGGYDLWSIRPDGSDQKKLTSGPFDDRDPMWSPDGSKIAFASDRGQPGKDSYNIWTLDVATGALTQVTDNPNENRLPTWSPDGKQIAYASTRGAVSAIYSTALGSPEEHLVRQVKGTVAAPSWGPGGQLAYVVADDSSSRLEIDGKTVSGTENVFPFRVSWLPKDGGFYYVSDGKVRRRLAAGAAPKTSEFTAALQVARPGYDKARRDFDSVAPRKVLGINRPAISPDGTRIAFAALEDIYLAPVGGGAAQNLTHDTASQEDPAWSPDGSKLVYTSDRGGGLPQLWIRDMASGQDRKLTSLNLQPLEAVWSQDGTRIAFIAVDGMWGTAQLGVADVASGGVTWLSPTLGQPGRPTWSGDGKHVAVSLSLPFSKSFREGTNQIAVYPSDHMAEPVWQVPVANLSIDTRGGAGPVWSPGRTEDGRHLRGRAQGLARLG